VSTASTIDAISKTKCPSTDKRKHKMWSIHSIEYYSALKNGNTTILEEP
jgi:hypothetical protein